MNTAEEKKALVKEKYGQIAIQARESNQTACCGSGCCSSEVSNIMTDDYSQVEGYQSIGDLGLGCGLPTQFARIKKGDVVIDLGSGAGNDCFIARAETGEAGKVIGIDFTPAMIARARENAEKLGFNNVEFRQGDIENIPISSGVADVIVSNCVLNLVPDKNAAFREIFRVLKAGGHFSISDVVLIGDLPESLRNTAEMYVGCVAGALRKEVYLDIIALAGFKEVVIQKEKAITVPEDVLRNYLSSKEMADFKKTDAGIYSITVYAEKPNESACCDPGCCK